MIPSSVASHDSDVFDCLMQVGRVAATSGACKTMAMHQMLSVSKTSEACKNRLNQLVD